MARTTSKEGSDLAVTSYHTIGGQILSEQTGGVRTEYVHDALGSVIATTDANRNVLNTYRYAPYGTQISSSGSSPNPMFQWVGTHGYRATGLAGATHYVRARHYDGVSCTWSSWDEPYWSIVNPYAYASGSPERHIDYTGWFSYEFKAAGWPVECSDCGAAYEQIKWIIASADIQVGYIVQHIKNTSTITQCDGTAAPQVFACPEYWEAWVVKGGQVSGVDKNGKLTNDPTDTFIIPGGCNCSHGTLKEVGYAKLISSLDGLGTFYLPCQKGSVSCAGFLWSTSQAPPNNKWVERGGISRTLETDYCCCYSAEYNTGCKPISPPCTYKRAPDGCTATGATCTKGTCPTPTPPCP